VALGALLIKERLGLTDRETVEAIQENPYLQFFIGYEEFSEASHRPSYLGRSAAGMKSNREYTDYLQDILNAATKARQFVKDVEFEAFRANDEKEEAMAKEDDRQSWKVPVPQRQIKEVKLKLRL